MIGWSYWIGVGQESKIAYKQNINNLTQVVQKGAELFYKTSLAGLALGAISNLVLPKTGEDVSYYFISNYNNVYSFLNDQPFFSFDKVKGRAAFGRNDQLKEGTFYIGLNNDNLTRGIEVNIKVVAVKEVKRIS